jgi:hypothetical protein
MEIMNNDNRFIEISAHTIKEHSLNSVRKSLISLEDGRLKADMVV